MRCFAEDVEKSLKTAGNSQEESKGAMDFGGDRNSGSSDHSWCSGDEEAEDEEAVSGNGVQR